VIPASVEYVRASSIDQALDALADPEAKVLAGGHSLVPMMKLRLAFPSLLVDIGRLEFRGVDAAGGSITVGALTTYDELVRADGPALPDALRESAAAVGDVQVRNMGTVGGAIAHADPASDVAAAVLALGVRLRLRSAAGTRDCPAEEFFVGPFTSTLEQQELLTEFEFAASAGAEGSAYRSIDDAASGYSLAGAAVRVRLDDAGVVTECAIGLTGAASFPRRLPQVEQALLGNRSAAARETVRQVLSGVELSVEAERSTYRRQLTMVAITRAFDAARSRAERGQPR
jgi:aerobic carbon-monoxide dehydrogenase medium subunit